MPPEAPHSLVRLLDFPASTLAELAASFEAGPLRYGLTEGHLQAHVGSAAPSILSALQSLVDAGCQPTALAIFCRTLAAARQSIESAEASITLALSGPPVAGTPVIDTPTVVRSLFSKARHDVLIASYVFREATHFFAPLADHHDRNPALRVRFVVDLSHQRHSKSEPLPIIEQRFLKVFLKDHWPGKRPPELWHDPRFAAPESTPTRGVMHAKIVVVDQSTALVTSANFTAAAQNHNIEAGLLLRHPHQVKRILSYFEGLMKLGMLRRLPA